MEDFFVIGGQILLGLLVPAAVVTAIAILTSRFLRSDAIRHKKWMAQALEMDMKYQPADPTLGQRLSSFKSFSYGYDRQWYNVLSGSVRNTDVTLADYHYSTGSGKSHSTKQQTVCILRSPRLKLPHCFLRRQIWMLDFLGKIFGGKDIDFPSDPEFSKAFVLQGHDEAAIGRLFDSDVRRHYLSFRDTWIQFEGLGDTMMLHFDRPIEPQEASDLVEKAFSFLSLFEGRG